MPNILWFKQYILYTLKVANIIPIEPEWGQAVLISRKHIWMSDVWDRGESDISILFCAYCLDWFTVLLYYQRRLRNGCDWHVSLLVWLVALNLNWGSQHGQCMPGNVLWTHENDGNSHRFQRPLAVPCVDRTAGKLPTVRAVRGDWKSL